MALQHDPFKKSASDIEEVLSRLDQDAWAILKGRAKKSKNNPRFSLLLFILAGYYLDLDPVTRLEAGSSSNAVPSPVKKNAWTIPRESLPLVGGNRLARSRHLLAPHRSLVESTYSLLRETVGKHPSVDLRFLLVRAENETADHRKGDDDHVMRLYRLKGPRPVRSGRARP